MKRLVSSALLVALLALAGGCATAPKGPTLPAPIPMQFEQAPK
jgi:hypothetical protein